MPTSTTTGTLTNLLAHLVRFATISTDQATNRAALDWIEQQLQGLPLHIKRLENNGHSALVATTPAVTDPKNPKLWLAAHTDVVAAVPNEFEATIRDGRLYGRGTHDMKYAIATFIALLQELGPELANYDLGLIITSDEETGGQHGVGWLVDELSYRGQAVFLPDSAVAWEMAVGAKGIMWWELEARGHTAHSSRHWEGTNAIDEMMRFITHLRTNVPTEPCTDPTHNHTTINFSSITTADTTSTNQVPDSVIAKLDIRITPDTTFETVGSWMDTAHAAVPNVTAKAIQQGGPFQIGQNAEPINRFAHVYREVTGQNLPTYIAHGTSDARYFAWKGVPVIDIGIIGSGYHVSPEWIDLADLARFYELTRRFVDEWASM